MRDIYAEALQSLAPIFRAAGGNMSGLYHDKETRVGMSDEVVEDEREAIAQAAKAIAACRSELLDAQVKMTSARNKTDLDDLLMWLPTDITKWTEIAIRVLGEERDS